jgi:hypothetical protein
MAEGGLTAGYAWEEQSGETARCGAHGYCRERKNGMLTCELQGPNAKYMLYPYYVTLVATSGGTFTFMGSDTSTMALTNI